MKDLIPEHQIQAAFFDWINTQSGKYPQLALGYAIPNGANKSIKARMKFKREGLRAGVPDFHLPVASNGYIGLWIEFKSRRGSVQDTQKAWIEALRQAGHRVEICRETIAATEIVREYLGI